MHDVEKYAGFLGKYRKNIGMLLVILLFLLIGGLHPVENFIKSHSLTGIMFGAQIIFSIAFIYYWEKMGVFLQREQIRLSVAIISSLFLNFAFAACFQIIFYDMLAFDGLSMYEKNSPVFASFFASLFLASGYMEEKLQLKVIGVGHLLLITLILGYSIALLWVARC